MPSSPLSSPSDSGEKPLGKTARGLLIASAAFAICLFYFFAVGSVLLLVVFLAGELIAFVALMRFGLVRVVSPTIERHSSLLMLFVRSFWLRKRAEFRVPISDEEAPRLFVFLRQLSEQLQVPAPRQVLIEMSAGAWVMLKGFRQGADATTLGLGYDLLAGLTEREVESVLAHEMAHAKSVRRGLKRWLAGGVSRAAKLTNQLAALVNACRQARQNFALAAGLLRAADACTRLTVRLVATYSRQDEFEADRGAAEVCGAAPLRSALIKLEHMSAKTARIGWNERVAQLQRGEGFSSWLVGELATGETPAEPGHLDEATDRYSTHPSLRDRLAAMPPDDAQVSPSPPAIHLFANPDAVAAKLVAEIQRVAGLEENRDTRERRRWLKRQRRSSKVHPLQWPGMLIVAVAATIGFFAWADGFRPGILVCAILGVAAGCWLYRLGRYRDRRRLPVPDYTALKAAWELPDDHEIRKARENELMTALRARVRDEPKKRHRKLLLLDECYEALGQCDYLRAHVAARLVLELDKTSVEARLALAIAWAAFHHDQHVGSMLAAIRLETAFASPSALWGAGWALVLAGDWAAAEAFLEEARRRTPDEPTFAALLSLCQSHRNKLQAAIANARIALAASPGDKERLKLLVDLLIRRGDLREARELLANADGMVRSDPALLLSTIRLHLLQRSFDEADQWTEVLRQHGVAAHHSIALGQAHETARRDESAGRFYESALEKGHYPEAHLGMARLAAHRRDPQTARQHLTAALNNSRTAGEKGRGALEVFTVTLGQFLQLQTPIGNARAWVATINGSAGAGPLANQSFLIFASDMKEAETLLRTVTDAVEPDKPPLLPAQIGWKDAPQDQQPAGAVPPGIQRFWRQ